MVVGGWVHQKGEGATFTGVEERGEEDRISNFDDCLSSFHLWSSDSPVAIKFISQLKKGFWVSSKLRHKMALREGSYDEEYELHVLIEKEEKFWLNELEKITLGSRERFLTLEHLIDDAYAVRQPKQREYQQRKELVQIFNRIAKELYSNSADCPIVEEFGSFSMGVFTSESDLDLSINFSNSANVSSRNQVITTLRRFKKKLYALKDEGIVCDILPILNAKVPVLKVVDVASGIECDLSVENRDGISKSKIIYLISSLDERFQKLCILMKAWAKAHGVNSPKDRTLSSLSIVLLVTFHLQTRDPPILPPFSAILKDGEDLEIVKKSVERFENYGRRNTESLGELFVSFLIKLASVAQIWPKGLCASPYHGRWISKTWTRIASIRVEDFTDHTQNVARAVGSKEADEIFDHIVLTICSLNSFMNGHIDESDLKQSLFGNAGIARNTVQSVMINKPKERKIQHDMNINSLQNRKGDVANDGWEVQATQNRTTRIKPPTVGYWRPKQNQDMNSNTTLPVNSDTTTPESTPQGVQPVMRVDLESTKNAQGSDRLKFGGIPEATQSLGETGIGDWGGLGSVQGWERPSNYYNGCWGGFQGAYFLDPHHNSQGIQSMEETRPQQPPPGTCYKRYGTYFSN
ncbi:hypothetical protein L6452_03316 [Arctium lappa]|uniref:Uncharacterized protein n=1 Tax=Arctium lappa TaxID=4217 RepID=A0ACB9FMU2_ARCLA|nr:hypothetical protein L6452_03316 [Arctium lappa]